MIVVLGAPALVESPDGDRAGGLAGTVAVAVAMAGGSVQVAGKLGDDPAGDRVLLALAAAGVGHAAMLRDPAHATEQRSAPAAQEGPDAGGAVWSPEPDDAEGLAVAVGLIVESGDQRNGSDGTVSTSEDSVAHPEHSPDAAGGSPVIVLEAADIELALRYLVEFRVLIVATSLDDAAARVVADAAAFAGAHVIALDSGLGLPAALGPATVLEVPTTDPDARFADLVGRFALGLDRGAPAREAFREALGVDGWERIEP